MNHTRNQGSRGRAATIAVGLGSMAGMVLAVGGQPTPATAGPPPPPCSLVQPCRLSTTLPPSTTAPRPVLSPDGDTAVFVHTSDDLGNVRELYSVPVRGGADPVRLDPPQAPPSRQITVTPDGERVLYLSERSEGFALFSVPINGPASAAVRLSPAVLGEFEVSPDSRLVAYQTTTRRVRAVPVAGPESRGVALTDPGTATFGIGSDSRNLVYTANGAGGERELLRVPLTLSPDPDQPPTRLSGPIVDGGGVHSFRLPVGPGPVVYAAAEEVPNVYELYRVGFGGGQRTKLSLPLPAGWRVGLANDHPDGFQAGYGISRDGQRVVYEIRAVFDSAQHRLYGVPSAGPASAGRRLDVTTPNTSPTVFHLTGDSRRVVYVVADRNGGPARSFSVPIGGPADARVQVSSAGDEGGFVQVSPDGQRVVSRFPIFNQIAALSGPVAEPYTSPNAIRLNGPEQLTGSVVFDPLSRRVAYVAVEGIGERDVYSSALRSRSRFNLTATLSADFITGLVASDQHAVYAAEVGDDAFQLYSSRLVPGSSG